MSELREDNVWVKEPTVYSTAILIGSEKDVDCVMVDKDDIPELIAKLETINNK